MTRPGWMATGLGVAALAVGTLVPAGAGPATARLARIFADATAGQPAIVLETTEPVAYVTAQPDRLTVTIDLRNATANDVENQIAGQSYGPVQAIDISGAETTDGVPVARVKLRLREPVSPRVTSARQTIRVAFTRPDPVAAVRGLGAARGVIRLVGTGAGTSPETRDENADTSDGMIAADDITASTLPPAPEETAPQTENAVIMLDPLAVLRVQEDMPNRPEGLFRPADATQSDDVAPAPAERPVQRPTQPESVERATTAAAAPAPQDPAAPAQDPDSTSQEPVPAPQDPAPAAQGPPPAAPQDPPTATQLGGPTRQRYTGHPVSLDFQNADLRAVLRTFAEISGLNIVIDPTVQGSVDVALTDVPWDQALAIILRANGLDYEVEGTVVRIAPVDSFRAEAEQRRERAEANALAGTLEVLTQTLSYARAADLRPLLTNAVLSPRGQIQVDERTNTLIITDLPERIGTASQLIATLDRPEPQVEIEARIVQTTREFARALGVQWGLNGRVSQDLANNTSLSFPSTGSITGRAGPTQGPEGLATTAVDLAADNPSSAIGLALGSVNGAFNLDIALSALERTGEGRILSTPRVTTQNNVAAEMTQGVQIPIQTVANNTVTVSFQDAALVLQVTPQITAADTVIMEVSLENAAPDFTRAINGIPPIDTQRANTTVQVSDGQTTVIGGIFVSSEQSQNARTPFLHRIPLLGWLFKRNSVTEESRELLIFITPRILRQE